MIWALQPDLPPDVCCEVKMLHPGMQYPTQRMHDAAFDGCLMLPTLGLPTPVAPLFLHFAHSGDEFQNTPYAPNPHCVQAKQPLLFCSSPPFLHCRN
jgi:hypothetical protein